MTTTVRMTQKERKERLQNYRRRQARILAYRFICWLENAVTEVRTASVGAPQRIKSALVDWFVAFVCLMLMFAVFFAAMGLMAVALDFWLSTYPGW